MPERTIINADALVWLAENAAPPEASVVTSLPDVSELGRKLDAWKVWFVATARTVMRWVPASGVAIFYQSSIRQEGVLVDKGYLIMRAAEEEGIPLLWHKVVCRRKPGATSLGRPSFSHLICVGREPRRPPNSPDVLPDAGSVLWTRGMGENACRVACAFLREATDTRVVVDPFCGLGSALAVANTMGFDTIGVEISAKRCRAARNTVL